MGKKKKLFLEFKRFGKIKKKWEAKFASLLGLATDNKVEEVASPQRPEEQEILIQVEEPKAEEKPKTTRKRKAATKKASTPATKKTTSTTRKRRTTKTKADA